MPSCSRLDGYVLYRLEFYCNDIEIVDALNKNWKLQYKTQELEKKPQWYFIITRNHIVNKRRSSFFFMVLFRFVYAY